MRLHNEIDFLVGMFKNTCLRINLFLLNFNAAFFHPLHHTLIFFRPVSILYWLVYPLPTSMSIPLHWNSPPVTRKCTLLLATLQQHKSKHRICVGYKTRLVGPAEFRSSSKFGKFPSCTVSKTTVFVEHLIEVGVESRGTQGRICPNRIMPPATLSSSFIRVDGTEFTNDNRSGQGVDEE